MKHVIKYTVITPSKIKLKIIILTLEGGGDDSSATISFKKIGDFEKYKTNEAMMGRLYRYITLLLGMKPGQHEYKVMGLAPYGSKYHGIRALEFSENLTQ